MCRKKMNDTIRADASGTKKEQTLLIVQSLTADQRDECQKTVSDISPPTSSYLIDVNRSLV